MFFLSSHMPITLMVPLTPEVQGFPHQAALCRVSYSFTHFHHLCLKSLKSHGKGFIPARLPLFKMPFAGPGCHLYFSFSSVQFSSVAQSCPTFCDPMNRSTPGLPVHHQPPEFTQTHVHRLSDAIQPSHPLSSPSPPAPNPSQHQSLFQ